MSSKLLEQVKATGVNVVVSRYAAVDKLTTRTCERYLQASADPTLRAEQSIVYKCCRCKVKR